MIIPHALFIFSELMKLRMTVVNGYCNWITYIQHYSTYNAV